MKKVLITGGCGCVGVNLAKLLQLEGYHVRLFDNLSVGRQEYISDAKLDCSDLDFLVTEDIRDSEAVKESLVGIDAVVHLAAFTKVIESMSNPREVWDINVTGTLFLLEVCRNVGIKRFVFASSNAVLGDYLPPFSESLVPQPISPMGASKAACEMLCSAYNKAYGMDTVSLRFSNCYGLYSKHKTSVISKFIQRLMVGKPLTIYGDGKQSRDFVNVIDVCSAIAMCLEQPKISGVFHIGSGVETSINLLISMLTDIAGINPEIAYKPARLGEIQRNYSDISKARTVLGYNPTVKLEDGLKELWDWYNK